MNKLFIYSILLAFALWFLPFMLRILVVEMPQIDTDKLQQLPNVENKAVQETLQHLSDGNKQAAFVSIFTNNIKGCILNILGGVFLGLGTLISLAFNGFVFADVMVSIHSAGMSIHDILRTTLPHSFELIGTWLSGGIGFYIAWLIICFMQGKKSFTSRTCKLIGMYSIVVFLIILSAAYVEAFITPAFIR
jgi:uncharacterized membrane protein SpoIIM required for sporulation